MLDYTSISTQHTQYVSSQQCARSVHLGATCSCAWQAADAKCGSPPSFEFRHTSCARSAAAIVHANPARARTEAYKRCHHVKAEPAQLQRRTQCACLLTERLWDCTVQWWEHKAQPGKFRAIIWTTVCNCGCCGHTVHRNSLVQHQAWIHRHRPVTSKASGGPAGCRLCGAITNVHTRAKVEGQIALCKTCAKAFEAATEQQAWYCFFAGCCITHHCKPRRTAKCSLFPKRG
jgi:hypothetical protein